MTAAARHLDSEPTLTRFNPDVIPYQRRVIDLVREDFDYSSGNLELLLSGAYGSAKSTLLAHLAVTHCLLYPGARAAICRRARQDIKSTIWREILDHIEVDLVEDVDYSVNLSELKITFSNGSEIVSAFWGDKKYKKFRSWKLSMVLIEEIVENNEDDMEAFKQLKARLRRIPGIPENVLAAATNPDAPTHWVYSYFIEPNLVRQHPTRYVFYSCTEDNPFIDRVYFEQLRTDLPPREAARFLRGEWIELTTEVVYYAYDSRRQFRDGLYKIDWRLPIAITFDFNIGHGKPMSAILFQYDPRPPGAFHFFSEVIIHGARTADLIEEMDARGYLNRPPFHDGKPDASPIAFVVCGDASGKHKDTRSSRSDYDIILHELASRGCRVVYNVPMSNPPIRTRHNRVNAYCKNDRGDVRLFIYKDAPQADKGMRLVKIKPGADYLEDDSKEYQHVTTAMGYAICSTYDKSHSRGQGTVQL